MTLTDPIFGALTGQPAVEFAVLDTLEAWVPYMLRVLERRWSLPPHTLTAPPGRTSYTGGLDFETWREEDLPTIIAVVNPTGDADRDTDGYSQWFSIEIGVIVNTESEDESRALAGHIGTAVSAALPQHGDLGGIATFTRLVSAAVLEFPDPENRTLIRARVPFAAYVTGLVNDLAGTRTDTPPESTHIPADPDAESPDWPEHLTTNITVNGTLESFTVPATTHPETPGVGTFREAVDTFDDLPQTGNELYDVRLVVLDEEFGGAVLRYWDGADWLPIVGSGSGSTGDTITFTLASAGAEAGDAVVWDESDEQFIPGELVPE